MRRGNEDNLHADANEYRGLFIVADGMGGHAAGEIASQMAVEVLTAELAEVNDLTAPDSAEKLSQALKLANRSVYQRTTRELEKSGSEGDGKKAKADAKPAEGAKKADAKPAAKPSD